MSTTEPKIAKPQASEKFLRFAFGTQPVQSVPRELYATITEEKPSNLTSEDASLQKMLQTAKGNSLVNAFQINEPDQCPILKVLPAIWEAILRLEDWFKIRGTEYAKLRKFFPQWSSFSFTSRDLSICALALLQPFDRQVFVQRLKTARIPAPLFHLMLEGDKVKLHWNWMKFAIAFHEPHQIIVSLGTKEVTGKSHLLPHLFVDEQDRPVFETNGQSGALLQYSADVCFASLDQRNVAVVDVHSSKSELNDDLLKLLLAFGHKFIIHVSSQSFVEGLPTLETSSIFLNLPKESSLVYWRDWDEDYEYNNEIEEFLSSLGVTIFKLSRNVTMDLSNKDRDPETLAAIDDARETLHTLCRRNQPEGRGFWDVHDVLKSKRESVSANITIETAPQGLEDLHHKLAIILASSNKLSELFPYLVIDQANSLMNIGTKGKTTWDVSDGKVTENEKKCKVQVDNEMVNKWKALREGSLSDFMVLFKDAVINQDIEAILEFNQQIVNAMSPWVQPRMLKRLKLHEVLHMTSPVLNNPKEFKDQRALDEHSAMAQLLLEKPMADIKKDWESKQHTPSFWQVVASISYHQMKAVDEKLEQENVSLELCWRELILYYNIRKPNDNVNILKGFEAFIQAGFPLELLNGDTGTIHERPFLSDLLANLKNEDVKVISIFGPQSSGKSTLLNYLFGSQFAVSAGRCTRGMNISYVNTRIGNHKGVLVVDTEGFLAVERGDRHFDVQMALLSIACSNTVIINMAKNIDEPMCNILSVAIYCLHRIRINTSHNRPTVKIVLRDVDVTEEDKDTSFGTQREKILDKLSQIAKIYDETLDALGLGDISVEALPPAFIRKQGNSDFSTKVKSLRSKLLAEPTTSHIRAWGAKINAHWSAILDSSLYTNFDSVIDIFERQLMQREQEKFLEDCFGPAFRSAAINKIAGLFAQAKQILLHDPTSQVNIGALETRLKVKEELSALMPDQEKIQGFIKQMKDSLKTEDNKKMFEKNIKANYDEYEVWLWDHWQKKAWDLNQFSLVSQISKELDAQMFLEAKNCKDEASQIAATFKSLWSKTVEKLANEVQKQVITIEDARNTLRRHWKTYAKQNNTNLNCIYSTSDVNNSHKIYMELLNMASSSKLAEQYLEDKKFFQNGFNSAWEIVHDWLSVVKQDVMENTVLEQGYDVASKIIVSLNSRLTALGLDLKKKGFCLNVSFDTMIHMEMIHHFANELHKVSQADANHVIKSFEDQRTRMFASFQSIVKSLANKSSIEGYVALQISTRLKNNFLESVRPSYEHMLREAIDAVKPSELVELGYKKAFLDGENSNFSEVYEFCNKTSKYLKRIFLTWAVEKERPIWEQKCDASIMNLNVDCIKTAIKSWGQVMFMCLEKFELNGKPLCSLIGLVHQHLCGKEMDLTPLVNEVYYVLGMEASIDKNEEPISGQMPPMKNISSLAEVHIKALLLNHFGVNEDDTNGKTKRDLVKQLVTLLLKKELLQLENNKTKQFEDLLSDLVIASETFVVNIREFAVSLADKIDAGDDAMLAIRQNKDAIIREAWLNAWGCGEVCPFCKMKCTAQPSNGHQHVCSRHILYCFGGTTVGDDFCASPGICTDPANLTKKWRLRGMEEEAVIFQKHMERHFADWIITPDISNANAVETLLTQAKAYFVTGAEFEEHFKMKKPNEEDYPEWWPVEWRRK